MSTTIKMSGGDIYIERTGRPAIIDKINKASQDVAETFLNEFDIEDPPWYITGAEFWGLIGSLYPFNSNEVSHTIEVMVQDALDRLISAQEDDPYVDDEELIADIQAIWVEPVGQLSWSFYSKLVTDSDEEITSGATIDLGQQLPNSLGPDKNNIIGVGVPM
jgi:hypothetical protein